MLRSVPEDGVLFVEGDNAFLLAYLLQVRGERPDVTVYDRNGHLFADELREAGPVALLGESRAAWRIRREQTFAMGSARPVEVMTSLDDVVAEYLGAGRAYQPYLDGRIEER